MKYPPIYFQVFSPPALHAIRKSRRGRAREAYSEAYRDILQAYELGESPQQVRAVFARLCNAHQGFEEAVSRGAIHAFQDATEPVEEVPA